jgi:transposase
MPIVGGLDIHRKQITFDYLDTGTGQVCRGQISPADRVHLRAWLARFAGREDAAFALEACTGWRYIVEELTAAGIAVHLAEPADTAFARGRKRHAKTDKTDARHLRMLLAQGRLPECWIPPARILEARALLELYHDLRAEHTAWVQRIRAVLFHHGAPALGEGTLRTEKKVLAARLYGVGPVTALAITCWLAGAGRFSSSPPGGPVRRAGRHRLVLGPQGAARAAVPAGTAGAALGGLRGRQGPRPHLGPGPRLLRHGQGPRGRQAGRAV